MMGEAWLFEVMRGIGRLFINPLLYWTILLLIIAGRNRIKREREHFGSKIYELFSEIRHTGWISVVFSVVISIVSIAFGILFTFEIILLLALITIILSIRGSFSFLSASYTIGITFILLVVMPFVPIDVVHEYVSFENVSIVHFISLAVLVGLFLFIESLLINDRNRAHTYPSLELGNRGGWLGQHELKRLAFIPFFAFVPTDQYSMIAPIWPYFEYGEQSFSLVFVPFLIGFQYKIRGALPSQVKQRLGLNTFLLSLIVMFFALSSLYIPGLAFVAIIIAIIGKEWITYRHRLHEKKSSPFFTSVNKGVKVLATIPNSRADQLEILAGETIVKVNEQVVRNSAEFYEALQQSGAFFKLDIIDHKGEIRFIRSAFYEEDHHELGLLFPEMPHMKKRANQVS